MKAINIKTEYLINPVGIDIVSPRITWNFEGGNFQDAFEIVYWVNGKKNTTGIINSQSMNYTFKDKFSSRDHIEFEINIHSENKVETSSRNFFEIGLLNKSDWSSKWISGSYKVNKKKRYPVDYFKKEFDLKGIKSARLYISACGLYEAFINDLRVGTFVLAPGSTDYKKRIQYQTYDVTSLLKEGNNVLNILLADGWYRGSIGAKGDRNIFGSQTKVIAQLEIKDEFDNITTINTDEDYSWSNDGPIRFADLKDGEIVDERMSPSYKNKSKVVKFDGNLVSSNNVFVEEHETSKPIKKIITPKGKIVYEFPYNVAGYLSFEINAKEGEQIDIVMGEMLDKEGELTLKNVQCVKKGKRTPLQEIHFIAKEGKNIYHSKFFYGGFKYIQVDSSVEYDMNSFTQIAIYSSIEENGKFNCSEELINIFVENTMRSLKSNSVDIPTDCPTRERMGWTGDSQLFFESATYLTDYSAFTRKHLVDVYDRQDKNGRLPQIAPYSAEDWYMDVMNGSVGWADVGILTPYRFYKKYGDIRILEQFYDRMVKYAFFMIRRCGGARGLYAIYAKPLHLSKENKKFGVNNGQSYGEWAEPSDVKSFVWTDFCSPHPEESMAHTIWMMRLMIEISEILGKKEHIETFEKYEKGITKAYQELVTKKDHTLDTDRQAKLVRPLYLNLLSKEQEEFAKARLVKAMENYSWRLGTGFLSTPFILYVLSEINPEYAYKLLENKEMPGWLYMAINNTGTIWEGWEGPNAQLGISSLNHYSKGAMVEWLFEGMCGIKIEKENRFMIKPVLGGSLSYASSSYQSIYGTISSSWKKDDDRVIFEIEVPSNTKATFIFKDLLKELNPGKHIIEVK